MDRGMLLEHLSLAEQHVAHGEEVLEHQQRVIDELRRDHHSDVLIEAAEGLLRSFQEVQDMHVADLTRLRNELAIPG